MTFCDRPRYLGSPLDRAAVIVKDGCKHPARFALLRDGTLEAYLCGHCRRRVARWGQFAMRRAGLRLEQIHGG